MHDDLAQDEQADQLSRSDATSREQPGDGGRTAERGDDGAVADRSTGTRVARRSSRDAGQRGSCRAYEPHGCPSRPKRVVEGSPGHGLRVSKAFLATPTGRGLAGAIKPAESRCPR